jgi:hypothetical protein
VPVSIRRLKAMFDSLDEKIKHDDAAEISRSERIAKRLAIAILSIFLFAGLYFAVQIVE